MYFERLLDAAACLFKQYSSACYWFKKMIIRLSGCPSHM